MAMESAAEGAEVTVIGDSEGGGAITLQEAVPAPGAPGGPSSSSASSSSPPLPPTPKDFPWSRCIMGCESSRGEGEGMKEGNGRELAMMLPCLHMLCSKTCIAKLLADQNDESGSRVECTKCKFYVTREQLSNWLDLEREFPGKGGNGTPAHNANQKEAALLCQHCVHDKVAAGYCPECRYLLCQSCIMLHPQTRATQKHVINYDLSELRKNRRQPDRDPNACQMHPGEQLTHACLTCLEKLCGECVTDHHDKTHKVTLVEGERERFGEKLRVARQVQDKFETAIAALQNKREDLTSHRWNKLMKEIHGQFEEMRRILKEREKEVKKEARKHFQRESDALDLNQEGMEKAKSSTDEFIKTGDIFLNDMDDMASINFLSHAESYTQWLVEMERATIDSFILKDFHISLDTAANIQAQKDVQEYCKLINHRVQPNEPLPRVSSQSSLTGISTTARAEPEHSSSKNANDSDDVEETHARFVEIQLELECNGETRTVVQAAAFPATVETPTEMSSGNSSPATTISLTVVESVENMAPKGERELMEEIIIDDEIGTPDQIVPYSVTGSALQTLSCTSTSTVEETVMPTETPSHSQLNDLNGESGTPFESAIITLEIETEAEAEVFEDALEVLEDGPISPPLLTAPASPASPTSPETINGQRGKRERKKASHPDFIDWRDIQRNNVQVKQLHLSEPASRCKRRSVSGPSEIRGPETMLQPLQPETSNNHTAGSKEKRRRQKRKHYELQLVHDDEADEEMATQSNWEGGSGYISEPEVEGGDPITKRRSIRVRRMSGQEDQQHDYDPEMPKLTPLEGAPCAPPKFLGRRPRPRGLALADDQLQHSDFPEAPISSIEKAPSSTNVPILSANITRKPKRKNPKRGKEDRNDDYCFICLDGGDSIVCCDPCPKVFHIGCHIPVLDSEPQEASWSCNFHTTKAMIDKEILQYPDSGENSELTEANKRHFTLACKFLMECYKIPELPTVRWRFPKGYLKVYGKAPYSLQYIKGRLCLGDPEPFGSVEEMLLAFKQMFTQAFLYLEKYDAKRLPYAEDYFDKVLDLVREYYPAHRDLFNDLRKERKDK